MSIFFQVDDRVVWNPANGVAQLFLAITTSAEQYLAVESGFSPVSSDEVTIDRRKLRNFREKLSATEHGVVSHIVAGYLDCLLVIEQRIEGKDETTSVIEVGKTMPT